MVRRSHRPTRDLDLLGFGDPDPDAVLAASREICAVPADDAATFDAERATIERIRNDVQYGSLRIKTYAYVDGARVRAATRSSKDLRKRTCRFFSIFPAPRLRSHVCETVIGEKFEAMVALGRANSRIKDLYDIWFLAQTHEFRNDKLARAIAAALKRRGTAIPEELPDCLTRAFQLTHA